MSILDDMSKEKIEQMVDTMADVLLQLTDAQTAEAMLRANGFGDEELMAIGFEVEV